MKELLQNDYFVLFLIIGLGIIAGNIKYKGIGLDLSAIIFIAIFFGYLGVDLPDIILHTGIVLFIFTISLLAGPGFFEALKKSGMQLILIVLAINSVAAVITIVVIKMFDVNKELALGVLTGALSNTPGLATISETTESSFPSIGYTIAYPVGIVGVILWVRFLHLILRKNYKREEENYINEINVSYPKLLAKKYICQNPNVIGKKFVISGIEEMTKVNIFRLVHNKLTQIPQNNTTIEEGDLIEAVGAEKDLEKLEILVGQETEEEINFKNTQYDVKQIVATNRSIINKPLQSLNFITHFNARITKIQRTGVEITPGPNTRLRYGDRLIVACDSDNFPAIIKILGNHKTSITDDFLTLGLGVVIGILIGRIDIPLPYGINFSLGVSGGILFSGLILSYLGKTGPIIWHMSLTTNKVLRELGLMLFLIYIGTNAGSKLSIIFLSDGLKLLVIGFIITMVPMIVGTYLLRKYNLLKLLGILTGGMTCTSALATVGSMSDSDAPSIYFASVYPLSLVCSIIWIKLIMIFL